MQELEKLREIDHWEEKPGEEGGDPPERSSGSLVPLVQAALCLLLLALVLVLKFWNGELFQPVAEWYREEMSQEIALPSWEPDAPPAPTVSPVPSTAASPTPQRADDVTLQRV